MNKTFLVLAAVMQAIFNGFADDASAEERYVFAKSQLSVPRQIGTLKFVDAYEHQPNGVDVQARFHDPNLLLNISIYVYQSPPDTKGPVLMLDADGKRMHEDREEVLKRHNAVFKLTQPSDSYLEEYKRTLNSIASAKGYSLQNEFRILAVPERNDSPIAYTAHLVKTNRIEDQDVCFIWKTYLYTVPGYFVKIHCTYPEPLWLEGGLLENKFIESINWHDFLPKQSGK